MIWTGVQVYPVVHQFNTGASLSSVLEVEIKYAQAQGIFTEYRSEIEDLAAWM